MSKKDDYGINNFDLEQFDDKAGDVNYLEDAQDPISSAQKNMIYSLFGQLSIDKADLGIEKVSSLKKGEASKLIEDLLAMKDEADDEEFDEDFEDYYGEVGEDLEF